MTIPTEPVGSVRCPAEQPAALAARACGEADDASTSRATAFAKIAARIEGTAMAAEALGAWLGLRPPLRPSGGPPPGGLIP